MNDVRGRRRPSPACTLPPSVLFASSRAKGKQARGRPPRRGLSGLEALGREARFGLRFFLTHLAPLQVGAVLPEQQINGLA